VRLIVKKTAKPETPNRSQKTLREWTPQAGSLVEGGQGDSSQQPDRAHIITGG
jgi:hypothetical protein